MVHLKWALGIAQVWDSPTDVSHQALAIIFLFFLVAWSYFMPLQIIFVTKRVQIHTIRMLKIQLFSLFHRTVVRAKWNDVCTLWDRLRKCTMKASRSSQAIFDPGTIPLAFWLLHRRKWSSEDTGMVAKIWNQSCIASNVNMENPVTHGPENLSLAPGDLLNPCHQPQRVTGKTPLPGIISKQPTEVNFG